MNLNDFDATQIAPREDFTPIPDGTYRAVIVDSESKPTKKGGEYLEFTYEVTDGEFKGRKVWSRHNMINESAKTEEIAARELSAICHAVGVMKPGMDGVNLRNKPLSIRVEFIAAGTPQRSGGVREKATNEVKAWKAVEGGNAPPFTPATQPANTGGTQRPSWAGRNAA